MKSLPVNSWRQIASTFPLLLCMAGIFYFSHQPGDTIEIPKFPGSDKILHALAYGGLTFFFLVALKFNTKTIRNYFQFSAALVFSTLYALSDELHQSFIPKRMPSVADVLADAAGAIVVVTLIWIWTYRHSTHSRKVNRLPRKV